jgi:hypothetical protein
VTKAIHLINRRDGASLLGLTRWNGHPNSFRSCCWRIGDEEAAALIGGWVYFHESKSKPSRFGGLILGFEPGEGDMAERKIILFQVDNLARQQNWRGADHDMGMWGGLVEADLPHETD